MNLLKRLTVVTVAFVGFSFLLSSCGGDDSDIASFSPKEALVNYASNENCQMAISVRIGDLIDKSGVQGDLLPPELKMMADSYLSQFLDSKETGVDLNSTAYVVGNMEGLPKGPEMVALLVKLTDSETFGAFLEGQSKMTAEEGDGYKFVALPNGKGVIAWNNGMAMLASGNQFKKDASGAITDIMKAMSAKGKGNTKEIENFSVNKADFGFFMDYEKYMDIMAQMPETKEMMESFHFGDMMKGAYLTGYLNFGKGEITVEYDIKGNSELKDFMASVYKNGNVNFTDYLGGENVIGFGTMSMSIDKILDMYEKSGFFETPQIAKSLNEFKDKTGLSIRDMASKFSGDFSISFVGLKEDGTVEEAEDDNPYSGYYESRKSTKPIIAMAIGIRDNEFSTMLDTIRALTKVQNVYTFPGDNGGMCLMNNILFITSDKNLLDDFSLDGRLSSYTKNDAKSSISQNPVYGYFSFSELAKVMGDVDPEAAAVLSVLDYAELKATKEGKFSATLHMKDKGKNSLLSLAKMIIDSASKMNGLSM